MSILKWSALELLLQVICHVAIDLAISSATPCEPMRVISHLSHVVIAGTMQSYVYWCGCLLKRSLIKSLVSNNDVTVCLDCFIILFLLL